jgi:hypothetical protein
VSRPGRERLGLSRQGWLWALAIVAGLVFSLGLPSVVGAGPTRSGPALSPRFSYDGPAASTTRLANARIVAIRGYDASTEVSGARTRVWGAVSAAKPATGRLGQLRQRLADETGAARVFRVQGDPEALGPHSVFKRDPFGRVNGYTTYGADGRAVKRFRGTGRPHGGMEPPIVYELRPGKVGGRPVVPREPEPWELPSGY